MLIRAGRQQPHPQRHLHRQVKRLPGHRRDRPGQVRLADLGDRQLPAHLGGVQDLLARLAVCRREHRAQHLMPPGHISQRRRPAPQHPAPRPAAAPPGCCRPPTGPPAGPGTTAAAARTTTAPAPAAPAAPAPPAPAQPAPASAASPAGVGASNTARTASSAPSTARTRLTSRTASSECPPRSKKLSSGPTRSRPSTCANTPHKISSRTVAGPGPPAAAA